MSIILKGIDMPKSCGGCEFNYYLEGGSYEWWECVILHDDINQFDTRRTDCPLVEIPKGHGDIKDINTVEDELDSRCGQLSAEIVRNAPTILEAEE